MFRLMFVCLGNICRSPMAEFVMKDLVKRRGVADKFFIASAGLSSEEEGSRVHWGTRQKLKEVGVPLDDNKRAAVLLPEDYTNFDYFLVMDSQNMRAISRIFKADKGLKVFKLMDFSADPHDVADPWYTGDFDKTYEDISEGCRALLDYLLRF